MPHPFNMPWKREHPCKQDWGEAKFDPRIIQIQNQWEKAQKNMINYQPDSLNSTVKLMNEKFKIKTVKVKFEDDDTYDDEIQVNES